MWQIEYTKEVRDYIYDFYPYTHTVWQTIKALRQSPTGLPATGYKQLRSNVFLWEVNDHLVVYERNPERRKLIFFVLKPAGEEFFDA